MLHVAVGLRSAGSSGPSQSLSVCSGVFKALTALRSLASIDEEEVRDMETHLIVSPPINAHNGISILSSCSIARYERNGHAADRLPHFKCCSRGNYSTMVCDSTMMVQSCRSVMMACTMVMIASCIGHGLIYNHGEYVFHGCEC